MVDEHLDDLDGLYWVDVKEVKKGKSRPNENYYYKQIIRPLLKWKGFVVCQDSIDSLHDWLLIKFSFEMEEGIDGKLYKRIIRSTHSKFDSAWQAQYHENIRLWFATEFDFVISEPNEDLSAPIDPKFKP